MGQTGSRTGTKTKSRIKFKFATDEHTGIFAEAAADDVGMKTDAALLLLLLMTMSMMMMRMMMHGTKDEDAGTATRSQLPS